MKNSPLTVAIDFDGVVVEERYPEIGSLRPGARETIDWLYTSGNWVIINSCRTGAEERAMIAFLRENAIPFHAANANLAHRIEMYGNDCRKIGADIYIDDRSLFADDIDWQDIRMRLERRICGVTMTGGRLCAPAH